MLRVEAGAGSRLVTLPVGSQQGPRALPRIDHPATWDDAPQARTRKGWSFARIMGCGSGHTSSDRWSSQGRGAQTSGADQQSWWSTRPGPRRRRRRTSRDLSQGEPVGRPSVLLVHGVRVEKSLGVIGGWPGRECDGGKTPPARTPCTATRIWPQASQRPWGWLLLRWSRRQCHQAAAAGPTACERYLLYRSLHWMQSRCRWSPRCRRGVRSGGCGKGSSWEALLLELVVGRRHGF